METSRPSADEGMTFHTIGRERLNHLQAIWSMLSGVPLEALRCQTDTMFELAGEEDDNPVRVHAAGEYVLRMNAVLLEKGVRVGGTMASAYMLSRGGKGEEPELTKIFWQEFDRLQADVGGLDLSSNPKRIAINLNQFLRVSAAHGGPSFDRAELMEALRATRRHVLVQANKTIRSRHHAKTFKCWVFERGHAAPAFADN